MKMEIAKTLPLFLVLMLAFATTCLVRAEDVDPVAEEAGVKIALTPEELLEKMVEAFRGVETFQMDMEMTMDMNMEMEMPEGMEVAGKTIEKSSLSHSASQVDLINQRMKTAKTTKTTMSLMPGAPEKVMEMETEMYWLDGIMYMKMPMMPWTKAEMPWVSFLEKAVDLLKVSQVDILGVEKVNGIESYAIKVVPDLGKFWEIMMGTMTVPGMELDPEAMGIDPGEMFQKMTMKTWVCRDTFLSVQDQSQVTMVLEGMEMEMSMISRSHSFNEPLTIELPAEAKEAKEMPEWCLPGRCP